MVDEVNGAVKAARVAAERVAREKEHMEIMSRMVRETTGNLAQAAKGLTLIVGPRINPVSVLGKTAATNTLALVLSSVNPLLPLAVRGASTAHTLLKLSRVKRIGLGEALFSAKKSIEEALEAARC